MIFVKKDDLKTGMRLARPIYNKNGVLLYERNSKLTAQGINSIKNFGLIGIFVLEPAEPVPPMTQDDIDFERFQTICVFSIQEELDRIIQTWKYYKIQTITSSVIKNYGHLDRKINFVQNLRSKEDYIYKHSLNVAILCAMIAHTMNVAVSDQLETVTAAIVHDIGKLSAPKPLLQLDSLNDEEKEQMRASEIAGYGLLEHVFATTPNIKRICMQAQANLECLEKGKESENNRMVIGAKILCVAETFDTMTAVQLDKDPESEVAAFKFLLNNPKFFEEKVVEALSNSINILNPGVSVELNTGDKALVLTENFRNILKPLLLTFKDNRIIDLSNRAYDGKIEITDIMKTMDNRHVMDIALLKRQGIDVEEPVYVEVPSETVEEAEEEYVPGMF
ncbi:MAG: HD domain-containing protein [Roseburia sp.]|nr:HD domain-containing protein [Ruminococcus sp.]MCM1156208.1 HD domain-containing protein [Roseburia sp.]MCM1241760.1 HD domain-containing protein [Roseburia sp.]